MYKHDHVGACLNSAHTSPIPAKMSAESPPKYVYKIVPNAPPEPIPQEFPLSDLDKQDGFIHLSTGQQVRHTTQNPTPVCSSLQLSRSPLLATDFSRPRLLCGCSSSS